MKFSVTMSESFTSFRNSALPDALARSIVTASLPRLGSWKMPPWFQNSRPGRLSGKGHTREVSGRARDSTLMTSAPSVVSRRVP